MPVSEGCRYSDEMHTLFVIRMSADLKKLDFEFCKIFTSLTPEISRHLVEKSLGEGRRTDYNLVESRSTLLNFLAVHTFRFIL